MDVLEQAIQNLGYSDDYPSYFTKCGIDSLHILSLFIEKGLFQQMHDEENKNIRIGHLLAIQSEANNIINARNENASIIQLNTSKIAKSQKLKKEKMKKNKRKKSKSKSMKRRRLNQKKYRSNCSKTVKSLKRRSQSNRRCRPSIKESVLCTENEKERLIELVADALNSGNGSIENINWSKIAQKLGTGRSANAVRSQYRRCASRNNRDYIVWAKEDDDWLRDIMDDIDEENGIDWKKITKEYNEESDVKRTTKEVQKRYHKIEADDRAKFEKSQRKRDSYNYFCGESDCENALNRIDAETDEEVFCEGLCWDHDDQGPISGDIYRCENGHEYCAECVTVKSKWIGSDQQNKIGIENESQSESVDESDIDLFDDEDDTDLGSETNTKCPLSKTEMRETDFKKEKNTKKRRGKEDLRSRKKRKLSAD